MFLKVRSSFLVLIFVIISSSFQWLSAQSLINSFDIAGFARPNLERKTHSINPSLIGGLNLFRNSSGTSNENVSTRLRVSGMQSYFKNSEKYQISRFDSYSGEFNYENQSSSLSEKNKFITLLKYQTGYAKKFFKSKSHFFEINAFADLEQDYQTWYRRNEENRVHNLFSDIEVNLPIYWGKGRIEMINDAWHAVLILKMLDDQRIIKQEVDSVSILEFANKIAFLKNLRNTDDRLESIAEYEELVNYLVNKNFVNKNDVRFFAHLRDAYQFESFTVRRSGLEKKIGLNPRYNIRNNLITRLNENSFRSAPSIGLRGIINQYKPKNLLWQTNQSHILELRYYWSKILVENSNGTPPPVEVPTNDFLGLLWSSSWEVEYLPNQRTNFSIRYQMGYNYNFEVHPFIKNAERHRSFLSSNFNFSMKYYLSPKLIFNAFTNFSLLFFHDFSNNIGSEVTISSIFN